jgi:hypothetical protein
MLDGIMQLDYSPVIGKQPFMFIESSLAGQVDAIITTKSKATV